MRAIILAVGALSWAAAAWSFGVHGARAAGAERKIFMDVHQLGPGRVTARDAAAAHAKDLAVQAKYGVKFLDYAFDEATGTVMCRVLAPDARSAIAVHREAHGLIPDSIAEVIAPH
jgi:hypothetical protein